jgi:ABC-type uncharacterized transport system permease subunit
VEVLPFRAVAATPVQIWVGQIGAADLIGALGFQLAWVATLAVLGWLAWQRARRVVTVYRG